MAITFSPARGIFFFPIPYSLLPLPCSSPPRVQQKFNSPKISSRESISHNAISPHKKSLPMLFRASHGATRAFSGQTRVISGQNWAILGQFWAFPGQNRAVLGLFPSPGSLLRPGRCAKTSPPSPRTESLPLHLDFQNSHKIALYYHK